MLTMFVSLALLMALPLGAKANTGSQTMIGNKSNLTDCSLFDDCVSCTSSTKYQSCVWCGSVVSSCISLTNTKSLALCEKTIDSNNIHRYSDSCPVTRRSSSFVSNWMENTLDVIKKMTLLDLSLPGTHDSLSYDLDLRVSDGGADDFYTLAEVLHNYNKVVPNDIEDYIRQQSQTQDLDITEQLNSGIRFIDARIMYEYSDSNPDWYSLHFMQTISPAMKYLNDIKNWMDKHPYEIVVLWLSKHGNTCSVGNDQYPNTPIEAKRLYWDKIVSLFGSMITDFSVTKLNETSIDEMLSRNHRVVIFASDYEEFTGSSQFALNGCWIDNQLGPGVSEEKEAYAWEMETFSKATNTIAMDKAKQNFFLMSMATGVPSAQMALAAELRFARNNDSMTEKVTQKCAAAFELPGFDWCPPTLLDISQLENYYKQFTLENTIQSALSAYNAGTSLSHAMRFPNAIYINGVDVDGAIRTGLTVLWGGNRDTQDSHSTTGYSYADSLILYNVLYSCQQQVDLVSSLIFVIWSIVVHSYMFFCFCFVSFK